MSEEVRYLEPTVREERLWNLKNVFLAFFIGLIVLIVLIVAIPVFEFGLLQSAILGLVLLLVYSIILFFLLEPAKIREVQRVAIRTIEKPVYKEVFKTVDRPVVKEVPVYIEKPVVKEVSVDVPRQMTREIYVEREREKLNIPKYEFVGSSETKTYHKRSCRFSKLIKRKYKESNNSEAFFKRKKYRACEVCIKRRN